VFERFQAVFVSARGDDPRIKLGRAVEVVIAKIEAGLFESPRQRGGAHAERRAGREPERLDALDDGADGIAPLQKGLAPVSRAARAALSTAAERHRPFRAHAGFVARAFRTIGAVFRAAAGFDRQLGRNLHRGTP
jgi:hypothetical protein